MDRLGIIVPYRNRPEHLKEFKKNITRYFRRNSHIDYRIIIVQQDDAKLFNRGMLLNIGFSYAKKQRCNYVIFHDVDMLPIYADYTPTDSPIHLATNFEFENKSDHRVIFDQYFGGVTMFPTDDFERINGYSNKYWGWGYEDDDLFLRCKLYNIPLAKKYIKNITKNKQVLKFNGNNALVKAKNTIDFTDDFSITVCFEPTDLKFDHTKSSDEYSIFSVPGYDFAISYTSFNRYNFCVFDSTKKAIYLNSEIKPTYRTNITLTYNNTSKTIKMYQDGVLIGETEIIRKFYTKYTKEEFIYLGVGNPDREIIPNWFKGYFEYFACFNKTLNETEILEIVNNKNNLLNVNFAEYKSADNLKLYYESSYCRDYKLIDLSYNDNMGEIVNCEIIEMDVEDTIEFDVPKRRESLFKSLKHEENGFIGNKWKDQSTRWNQLRFTNEVNEHHELIYNDGLNTLEFIEYGIERVSDKIQIINVGI
jgi:hypothetical protein